jgi:TAT (twin-arginine translocation) pathway signal sequence
MPIDENPDTSTGFAVLAKTTSRRTMLKGAAATGLTAATAGIAADILFAGPASAETTSSHDDGDLVAHVTNVRSGDIDLYVGTRHVSVRDRALATRLARAAR